MSEDLRTVLKPPFDDFMERQKRWGGIWNGSWFFGLAIRTAGPGELALVLGRLILRTPGIRRPNIRHGRFVQVPGIASGLMKELDQPETLDLLASLSDNAIPTELQGEFKEALMLPGAGEARWNINSEDAARGDQLPRVQLERLLTKPLHEVVGYEHVQRTVAALRSPGVHIDALDELARELRWTHLYRGTSPQMQFPTFEISADLPLRLLSFQYDRERSGYVARVQVGEAVPRPVIAVSLLVGMKESRALTEFAQVGQDSFGLRTYETTFESEPLEVLVKAALFFQDHEIEELVAPPIEEPPPPPFDEEHGRPLEGRAHLESLQTADKGLGEIRGQMEQAGWHLPESPKKLGGGGGGSVYQCFPYDLVDAIELGIRDIIRSGAVGSPSGRSPRDAMSDVVARMFDHLLSTGDAVGVVKVPHRADPRIAREIAAMREVNHPNLIRLYAADPSDQPAWFVMQYHPGGPIHSHAGHYAGRALDALRQVRPVIDAMNALHKSKRVHRDIKPNNIFIAVDGRWVLGDLGVVFERERERLTVGTNGDEFWSRDWRPDWVAYRKHEDYSATVDVFMLAKTLYYMISGGRKVAASQLDEPEFALRSRYPDQPEMKALDDFFADHIVTKESNCKSRDAEALGRRVDRLLRELAGSAVSLRLSQ